MKTSNLLRWLIILASLLSLMSYSQNVDTTNNFETSHVSEMEKGGRQFWENSQHTVQSFWQSNGYGLKKGEGYYQNVWLFGNQVSAGITNNFSIGFGAVPFFISSPIWVTPKVSIPLQKDRINLSIGFLAGSALGTSKTPFFGFAFSSATFGTQDRNFSVGLAYGGLRGVWGSRPTVTMSFIYRVGTKGYVISENYLSSGVSFISIGGRRLIKRVSLDFGLLAPLFVHEGFSDVTTIPWIAAIPWLGIGIPFTKNNRN